MDDLLTILIVSLISTVCLITLSKPIALKAGLVDKPTHRKRHNGAIPLTGGLAIYLCILLLSFTIMPVHKSLIVALTLIALLGVWDDFKNVCFKTRFVVEIIAALIMVIWGGVKLEFLGDLLGTGNIELGLFSVPFTVFAIVGGVNAFNMLDGIDGLAGSLCLISILVILYLSLGYQQTDTAYLCVALSGALLGFLSFNSRLGSRKKACVFLGDAGSMLLGFIICVLLVQSSQSPGIQLSPVTVLWIIAVPLFDTASIMIRRIRKGRSPFAPDREHFHHILLVAGYSVNQTVLCICLFSLSLAGIGLLGSMYFEATEARMFLVFIGLFLAYYWAMSHAWSVMKILRYIREHGEDRRKTKDRRTMRAENYQGVERRVTNDRRSGRDRRYQFGEREWRNISRLLESATPKA